MSEGASPPAFGKAEAEKLLGAGWLQGALFLPGEHVRAPIDERDVLLIVCTQSCSIVSADLTKDPMVEVAVARPLAQFHGRSHQAVGRDFRKLHLPVDGAAFPGVEVDVNTRFFLDRSILLGLEPNGPSISPEARLHFARWLGRYYTRAALPNALSARLRGTVFEKLRPFLEKARAGDGAFAHEFIRSMFVRWQPDQELSDDAAYNVEFLFLCDDPHVADELDRIVAEGALAVEEAANLLRVECRVQAHGETLVSDLDGFVRFSEWDYLSDPRELGAHE